MSRHTHEIQKATMLKTLLLRTEYSSKDTFGKAFLSLFVLNRYQRNSIMCEKNNVTNNTMKSVDNNNNFRKIKFTYWIETGDKYDSNLHDSIVGLATIIVATIFD